MLKYIITAILTFGLAVVICATWLVSGGQLDVASWKDIVGGAIAGSVVGSVVTFFILGAFGDDD